MKEKRKKEYDRETYDIRGGSRIRGWFSHALFEGISSGKREIRNMENSGCNLFSRCNKDKRN